MITQKTCITVKKGDRQYELLLAPDSPLGEVHDVLLAIKGYVVQRILEQDKREAQEVKNAGAESGV